jgi:opacity protein-like surface antigen
MATLAGFAQFIGRGTRCADGNGMKIFTRGKDQMSHLHFARVWFVLLLIVGSTTMLQAQAPAQAPCNPPPCSPAPAPSTHGAWEAYLFGGATTHSSDVFKDTFTVGDRVFETGARFPSAGTFGGKVGGFVTPNFSIDGNLSWYNHMFGLSDRSDVAVFRPITNTIAGIANITGNDVKTRALLWEVSGNYDFVGHTIGARFTPYVTLGVGGITARIKNADDVFITGGGFIRNPISPGPEFIVNPTPVRILENNDTFFTFSYGGGFKALRLAGPVGFRFDIRGRTIPNYFSESSTQAEFTGGLVFAWGER